MSVVYLSDRIWVEIVEAPRLKLQVERHWGGGFRGAVMRLWRGRP